MKTTCSTVSQLNACGKRPRIGLALGSGGARGWAHVGAILELLKHGIIPEIAAGTSAGSVVAAAYASGRLFDLVSFANEVNGKRSKFAAVFSDLSLDSVSFLSGDAVNRILYGFIPDIKIESMAVKYAAVAADLVSGESIVMKRGDILKAVRASVSIPGLFSPVKRGERLLVDGGIVDPLPVAAARAMGADVVIAVSIGNYSSSWTPSGTNMLGPAALAAGGSWLLSKNTLLSGLAAAGGASLAKTAGIIEILARSWEVASTAILRQSINASRPDILIEPKGISMIDTLDFHKSALGIKLGADAAARVLQSDKIALELKQALAVNK